MLLNHLLEDVKPSLNLLETTVFALGLVMEKDLGDFGDSNVVVGGKGLEGGFATFADTGVRITDLLH